MPVEQATLRMLPLKMYLISIVIACLLKTNAARSDQFVWWMEPVRVREGLRCVWEDTGALFAVMDGQKKMHLLCADRLDMTPSVSCNSHVALNLLIMYSVLLTCRTRSAN